MNFSIVTRQGKLGQSTLRNFLFFLEEWKELQFDHELEQYYVFRALSFALKFGIIG